MSRKILWHTVAQNKIGGYLFKGDDPLYYGDDPIYRVPGIEGPSVLQHGVVGTYIVSGVWEPEQVTYDADGVTIGATTSSGFTFTLDSDAETAVVAVYYEGRLIDTVYVQCTPVIGVVSGSNYLDSGDADYYSHNLGPSAVYTGNLTLISQEDDGALLMMPEDAAEIKTASFSGPCGASASISVDYLTPCERATSTGFASSVAGLFVKMMDGTGRCGIVQGSPYFYLPGSGCGSAGEYSWSVNSGTLVHFLPRAGAPGYCNTFHYYVDAV